MSKTTKRVSKHTDSKESVARRRAAHTARMKREKAIIKVISQTYYGDHQK